MAHHNMVPSDPWDSSSTGEPSSSTGESVHPAPAPPISIDRLAVLLSPNHRPDDLARDLQLNEIVVQACLATGATGAAIALARGDEFICRASTGSTAPDLGMRLNIDQGLSAFCVHTGEVQRCDDSESDARVDAEVCRHLGVRSVLVVPIVYGEFFLGIFEIFSPEPFAFYDRDIQTVLVLSRRALTALGILAPIDVAPEPAAPAGDQSQRPEDEIQRPAHEALRRDHPVALAGKEPEETSPVSVHEPATSTRLATSHSVDEEFYPQFKIVQKPPRDYWTGVLTVLVVGLALLLGWMIGHGRTARQNAAREELRAALAAQQKAGAPEPAPSEDSDQAQRIELPSAPSPSTPKQSPFRSKRAAGTPPEDGLVVYQEGKIIYRQGTSPRGTGHLPSEAKSDGGAASVAPVELTPEVAGALLSVRVEPHYPDRARRQNIQGPVILQALINEDGSVQQLKVLVGNPDLAVAAIEAVRHWRFKPYAVQGKPSQFATRITVNFALPTS